MSLVEPIACNEIADTNGNAKTGRVLLLGNDDRVILAVARGLGRHGICVDVAWCSENSPALKSSYVASFRSVPLYDPLDDSWIASLNELATREQYDLVIPCNDYAVLPMQAARDQLSPYVNWYLISDNAFAVAFDKSATSRMATELAIPTPIEFNLDRVEALLLSSSDEVFEIDEKRLRFPVFLKPRSSIELNDVTNKRAATRIETAGQLAEALREDCPADGCLIQEGFEGIGVGVEVLASAGKVLTQMQHKRLRETIDGGSTYREAIAEIPSLTEATAKMVERLSYTGVAMFEFRYSPHSGQWVFLEINARFWGSLPLALAAGLNFPYALYELLVNHKNAFNPSYKVGTRCRNLIQDIRAYRQQRGERFGWLELLGGRDHLDFLATDDWRPQLVNLGGPVRSVLRKLMRRR